MSPRPSAKHTHKFMKINGKFVRVWKCAFGCKFKLHQTLEEMLIGDMSICWTCGNEFLMTEENLKQEFPSCVNCQFTESQSHANTVGDNQNEGLTFEQLAQLIDEQISKPHSDK